jgi:hypothetical protein
VVKANKLGIGPGVYHEVFDSISQEWREVGAIFSVPTRRVPPLAEMYSQAAENAIALGEQGRALSLGADQRGKCDV